MKKILIISLLTWFTCNYSFAQWKWVHPAPQGNTIQKLVFISTSTGWAAGQNGTLLKTTNGGNSWSPYFLGDFSDLRNIQFTDSMNGSLGSGSDYFKTQNGGRSWTLSYRFPGNYITALCQLNSDTSVLATGNGSGTSKLYYTFNGGTVWTLAMNNVQGEITDIAMKASGNGALAGTSGLAMKTVDFGQTWSAINPGGFADFVDLSMPTNQIIILADADYLYVSSDGGATFTSSASPGTGSGALLSIDFANSTNGIAGCEFGNIYSTTDGGNTWTPYLANAAFNASAVKAASGTTFYVAGSNGGMYKSSTSGASWNNLSNIISELPLYAVDVVNGTTSFASGSGGTILKSTNGGTSWVSQTSNVGEDLFDINFANANTGLAVGSAGTILRTTDGGTTWNYIFTSISENLFAIDRNTANTVFICGENAKLSKSTNNGNTWSDIQTGFSGAGYNFIKLQCFGTDTIIVATDQPYLVATYDNGLNWYLISSPSGFETRSMYFTDAMNGYIGTGVGEIYHTTDGGDNWTLQYQTLSSAPINCIRFSSPENGWFTTANETYRTADGGITWSREINFNSQPINDIDFTGTYNAIGVGEGFASIFMRSNNLQFTTPTQLFCTDINVNLSITASGTFNPANDFIVELSDEFGEFGFPFILGTVASATTTNISVSIPNGLVDGTDYRVRIRSTDPPMWSPVNTLPIEIKTSPDAFINAGGPTSFCQGSSVTLYALTSTGWTYQWYVDGNIIPGATADTLVVTTQGNYTVEVTDGGCPSMSDVTDVLVFNCTGISSATSPNQYLLSPNPATDHIRLRNISGSEIEKIVLFSSTGQLLKEIQTETLTNELYIPTDFLTAGMYQIQIIGKSTETLKFIKL